MFANVLLVDEINRASPKTQSALLEAMQETQVTVDGETHVLERPFLVIATQNPVEYEGTYPLPEAQLDRFAVRMAIGYPPDADEARMLAEQTTEPPLEHLRPVAGHSELLEAIEAVRQVHVEESVNRYVVALLRHTRESRRLALGGSPRSGIALLRLAKARALTAGRDFVVPEDVQALAQPVLGHRLILAPEARATGVTAAEIVAEALDGDRGAGVSEGPRTGGSTVVGGVGTLAIVVVVAAWSVGATALAILGFGLALAALLAKAWTRTVARSLSVERLPSIAPTIEGEPLGLEVVLRGRPWLASRIELRDRIGPLGERRVALARNGSAQVVVDRAPRGRYALGPGMLLVDDPLGLSRLELPVPAAGAVLVRPRVPQLGLLFSDAGSRGDGGRRQPVRRPSGLEPHGVREYVEGEPLRAVHWATLGPARPADGAGARGRAAGQRRRPPRR